jgi:transposase
MGKQISADYSQSYLLPPSVEDWVPKDHPARFIRDFVDSLNLADLGFILPEATEGRPPYAVDLLLKVWLYGYLNRIRSSRKLEAACLESMSLIWLTGSNSPDHNTLWRFWAANKRALRRVFKQAVYVALRADLVGLVLHAVDGTKIAADVSRAKIWRRSQLTKLLAELDVVLEDVMEQVEQAEEEVAGDYRLPEAIQDIQRRRSLIQEALGELDRAERDYLQPHDAESRMMRSGDKLEMAFNAQVVVDGSSGLIVAADVVNAESDYHQLVPMVEEVAGNLGVAALETVADAGYYSPGQLVQAESKGYSVTVSMYKAGDKRWGKGEFQKANFTYDERRDVYVCPLGQELTYERTKKTSRGNYFVRLYRCRNYRECPRCRECSRNKRGRAIERGEHETAVERQRSKQHEPANRELLRKRKSIVEPVFAQIKEHQGFRRWSVRGLENVKTQWALICTAFNLRKLHRHWTAGTLVIA